MSITTEQIKPLQYRVIKEGKIYTVETLCIETKKNWFWRTSVKREIWLKCSFRGCLGMGGFIGLHLIPSAPRAVFPNEEMAIEAVNEWLESQKIVYQTKATSE